MGTARIDYGTGHKQYLWLKLAGLVFAVLCLVPLWQGDGSAVGRSALFALLAGSCWAAGCGVPLRRYAAAALIPAAIAATFAEMMRPEAKVWAVANDWHGLLQLSDIGATTACGVLLAASWSAARARRALSPIAAAAVVAVPLLFNLLLALASPAFMASIATDIAGELTGAWAAQAGRALALFVFGESLVVGIGLLMDRRWPTWWRLHGLLAAAAILAACTPAIADLGNAARVAQLPTALRIPALALCAALAESGLWALTFLATGVILDALHGRRPTFAASRGHWTSGFGKGFVYGGVFMLLIHLAALAVAQPWLLSFLHAQVVLGSALLGALLFPLARTLVESFDGSAPFFSRLYAAAGTPTNYLRGAVTGAGLGLALSQSLPELSSATRSVAGFLIGAAAYAGVDLLLDAWAIARQRRQRLQSWRVYLVGALVGGFVATALAWYFDATQLQVVIDKFLRYATIDFAAAGGKGAAFVVYPLFSKWGAISLGNAGGGVSLLYSESLAGVINWSIAAPLFSVNLVLLTALFQRRLTPLREMFSRAGMTSLVEQTVRVLRWGPWMAPIISSFLRMAPQPSWYNQDGAVRSVVATVQSWRLAPDAFRQWSLDVFLGLLAYDWLRILIWFDHMGLRVATLVNLSFVGADALDERAARFVGHSGRTRVIPEGVRRFLTWAPLLIPFYIPRGTDWDYAWTGAERLQKASQSLLPAVSTLMLGYAAAALLLLLGGALVGRLLALVSRRQGGHAVRPAPLHLGNGSYALELAADGRGYSRVDSAVRTGFELDLTRRPEDPAQLRGKFFYLRELDAQHHPLGEIWSLSSEPMLRTGPDYALTQPSRSRLQLVNSHAGVRVEAEISVDAHDAVERWDLHLSNLGNAARRIELTSYQELALGAVDAYRRTPPFAAMHVGTHFVRGLGGIIARNRLLHQAGDAAGAARMSHEVAFHATAAAGTAPMQLTGYEDSRSRFIGLGDLRAPAALDGRALRSVDDEGSLYTFDPIASLRVVVELAPGATVVVPFLDGYARDEFAAARLIERHLQRAPLADSDLSSSLKRTRELLDGAPAPADSAATPVFSDDGLEVQAPARAQRPWTHVLANPRGQGAVLGSDGEIFSFNGNAQQNCLSSFRLENLPTQLASQACLVLDLDSGIWLSPTFAPLRRTQDTHGVRFGRGYGVYHSVGEQLELELTVCIAPDAPLQLQRLQLRDRSGRARRLRVVHYCDIVLAETPADSRGLIETARDDAASTLMFSNPNNDFRKGWAFAWSSLRTPTLASVRSRFVGLDRGEALPHFARKGSEDAGVADDGLRVAGFSGEIELAADGTACLSFVLGQAPSQAEARTLIQRYASADAAEQALAATRDWWDMELGELRIETDHPEFDRLINHWLPYQVLTARLWARTGPAQRSGAFGYRDQLQDVLPWVFTRPQLARQQILLHARHQFLEGDAPKWWHPSWDGGTGICVRTAASDPHLWLPYVLALYVQATGDESLLDESCPFIEGVPLPAGREGIMFVPRVSRDSGTVYEHCRRAIELSLRKTGVQSLPLIGSGDWNDGIDGIGIGGRGESIWLGFFLRRILLDFAPLAERCEGSGAKERYLDAAEKQRLALEPFRLDGGRYIRALDDTGAELRFADALTAAWPSLSDAVHWRHALETIEGNLRVLEKDDRVLLLSPPFTEDSAPYPGRIAEYPPGVRENGGQYSHGVSWIVDALLRCADAAAKDGDAAAAAHCHDRAYEIWWKISPLSKAAAGAAERYGLSPHQQAADIYDGPGYAGRGGWSWYTGAAARMLSSAYDLLGLRMEHGRLRIEPPPAAAGAAPRLLRVVHHGIEIPLHRNP